MDNWLAVISSKVLSDKDLSSSAKVVFGAISSFTANGTKEAFPSHAAIAKRAGLGMRSIGRIITELVDAKYIAVRRRGRRLSNIYEVIAHKCDITEMCNHNPSQGDAAEMSYQSIKRNTEKNSIPIPQQAENIYEHYASEIRSGGAADAIRSITNLLKRHSTEELIAAIDLYAATEQGRGDNQYRYKANNFFGKKEYFMDFLNETSTTSSSSPPRKLTVEEGARLQTLIDDGLA